MPHGPRGGPRHRPGLRPRVGRRSVPTRRPTSCGPGWSRSAPGCCWPSWPAGSARPCPRRASRPTRPRSSPTSCTSTGRQPAVQLHRVVRLGPGVDDVPGQAPPGAAGPGRSAGRRRRSAGASSTACVVATGEGGLELVEVQPEGREPMAGLRLAQRGPAGARRAARAREPGRARHRRPAARPPGGRGARPVPWRSRPWSRSSRAAGPTSSSPGCSARSGLAERDRAFVTELVYGTVRMRRACDWLVDRHVRRPARRRRAGRAAARRLPAGVPAARRPTPRCRRRSTRSAGRAGASSTPSCAGSPSSLAAGPPAGPTTPPGSATPTGSSTGCRRPRPPGRPLAALAQMNEPASVTVRADGYVQDLASQWVAARPVGRPTPGERIVDLCAAPGGKATWLAYGAGWPIAVADRPTRCRPAPPGRWWSPPTSTRAGPGWWRPTSARLGLDNVATVVADACRPPLRPAFIRPGAGRRPVLGPRGPAPAARRPLADPAGRRAPAGRAAAPAARRRPPAGRAPAGCSSTACAPSPWPRRPASTAGWPRPIPKPVPSCPAWTALGPGRAGRPAAAPDGRHRRHVPAGPAGRAGHTRPVDSRAMARIAPSILSADFAALGRRRRPGGGPRPTCCTST